MVGIHPFLELTMTFLFAIWCFLGMIFIGLAKVKTPHDTLEGKQNPDVAWLAWTLMLIAWPLTVMNRRKFALYGDPKDENNPSWLSQS